MYVAVSDMHMKDIYIDMPCVQVHHAHLPILCIAIYILYMDTFKFLQYSFLQDSTRSVTLFYIICVLQ